MINLFCLRQELVMPLIILLFAQIAPLWAKKIDSREIRTPAGNTQLILNQSP